MFYCKYFYFSFLFFSFLFKLGQPLKEYFFQTCSPSSTSLSFVLLWSTRKQATIFMLGHHTLPVTLSRKNLSIASPSLFTVSLSAFSLSYFWPFTGLVFQLLLSLSPVSSFALSGHVTVPQNYNLEGVLIVALKGLFLNNVMFFPLFC